MTYTGLELLMHNLKQLINSDDNPLVSNNSSIYYERPQFQLLYDELDSMIQNLFLDQDQHLHELETVKNLKKRFKDVAKKAQDIIDLFVSSVNFRYKGHFIRSDAFKTSLNLEEVMRSIESMKVELSMIIDSMKMVSSPTSDNWETQSSAAYNSYTRNPSQKNIVLEDIFIGLNRDIELIRDKLVEDQKQLDVVSIVGMGGLGKTTLARKLFSDRFVAYHFHVRAWVTVSQTYEKRDFLIKVLASIGVEFDFQKASIAQLREMLHKSLIGKRYLIVFDDIWSKQAWDDLKLFFPNYNTGSRILLTTRLKEVALHAKLHGFVYSLRYLTEEESWELLCKKVFHEDECPKWLIEPGMQITNSCHGLPLAVVLIAGVLAKGPMSMYFWNKIAQSVSSYIVHDHKEYIETLALSFDHLPPYLRDCFLYLGGFPEDYKFPVRKLISIWMAEGFIHEAENRSLEDIAEAYLMDLVDRNLLTVAERKFDGGVKACTVHDLVREVCLKKATEERFFLKVNRPNCLHPIEVFTTDYKVCRLFTSNDVRVYNYSPPIIRSLFCFHRNISKIFNTYEYMHPYTLLMVLDLENCAVDIINFPKVIAFLVHLRYLSIWYPSRYFPSSICNLWNLQTFVVRTDLRSLVLPNNISNLVNLRHLWSDGEIYFPLIGKPMNLQTISNVKLNDEVECWYKCIPGIKKLACVLYPYEANDFESLTNLESLKLIELGNKRKATKLALQKGEPMSGNIHIRFPVTLKCLTLQQCRLPWSDMLIIQLLPNLEVLKLLHNAVEGPRWDTGEEQFRHLKFLKLLKLDIRQWEASSINFPCLKRLVLLSCNDLEEIPLEMGDIPTLELIEIDDVSSVVESVERIREEQYNVGNYELKINIERQKSCIRSELD